MTARLLQAAQPIAAPYNARNRLVLKTPDGSGATIHPSVVDMGPAGWNGYRYWMANTPYAGGDNQLENPCVWASHNRVKWVVPPYVVNPLVPAPGSVDGGGFHSDPDIVYDPDAGRMVIFYRLATFGGSPLAVTGYELHALTSTDGNTWTHQGKIADLPLSPEEVSPAVVRTGVNQWRMWLWRGTGGTAVTYTAASPLGPWGTSTPTTLNGGSLDGWHGDVALIGGTYYAAYSDTTRARMLVAKSADGIAWTAPATPAVLSLVADRWDASIYRPTIVGGPEAGYMSVWYSAVSPSSPGGYAIGFTRIPLSAWG